jgi:hypothetical protein
LRNRTPGPPPFSSMNLYGKVVRNERDFLLFIAALIFYNLLRHDILCGFSDEISGSAASARCNESHKI